MRLAFVVLNPRVINRIRYSTRRSLVDLNHNLTFDMIDCSDEDWARCLPRYTPHLCYPGFFRRLGSLGFTRCKSHFELCPVCGESMRKEEFIPSTVPSLPHFVRNVDGARVQCEPPDCIYDVELRRKISELTRIQQELGWLRDAEP